MRRSDLVRLGPQHVKHGALEFTAYKGRKKTPVDVHLQIGPQLRESIARGPVGEMVFLMTQHGKSYSAKGYGAWFKRQCRFAGIEDRSSHGLRKAAATVAAERGATAHGLKAMFGWLTLKQAERYTREADRKRLGIAGSRHLAGPEGEQKSLTSNDKTPLVREKGGKK